MEKRIFYVYQYINKHTSEPIYVGKGKSDRKYAHIREARKGNLNSPLCKKILELGFDRGIKIIEVKNRISEAQALRIETQLIDELGRLDLGTGPLLNRTSGDEGISGGINMYGYKKGTISGKITDMVVKGMFIEDMPAEIRNFVEQQGMKVKWVEERI